MAWRFPDRLVMAQASAVTVALSAMLLWPPASGRLLLVPIAAGSVPVVQVAVAGGALLLEAGPLPGSQVVLGDRTAIAEAAGHWPMLILAAPPAGCRADPIAKDPR
jgi:hypothetical protein